MLADADGSHDLHYIPTMPEAIEKVRQQMGGTLGKDNAIDYTAEAGAEAKEGQLLLEALVENIGVLSEESGCCVPGNLAQASIEDAMSDYGFLESEIEDFAEFWDPVFPDAKWITVRPKVEELPPLLPRSGVGTAGRARAPAGVVGALGIAGCQGNRAGLCVLKHERSTGAAAIRAVE